MSSLFPISTRRAVVLAAFMAALVAAILSLTAFAPTAYAGGGSALNAIYEGTEEVAYLPGAGDLANSLTFSTDAYKPITKVKSSNKKVATVKVVKQEPQKYGSYTQQGYYVMWVTFKKAGTTKITYTYKGKKHTVTFKAKKYANPFKSFKVGSREYKSCFNAKNLFMGSRVGMNTGIGCYATLNTSSIAGKLKVSPASGWKIDRIYYSGMQDTAIKNGEKVIRQFLIQMKNKKTGFVETFALQPTYNRTTATSQGQQSDSGSSSLQAAGI